MGCRDNGAAPATCNLFAHRCKHTGPSSWTSARPGGCRQQQRCSSRSWAVGCGPWAGPSRSPSCGWRAWERLGGASGPLGCSSGRWPPQRRWRCALPRPTAARNCAEQLHCDQDAPSTRKRAPSARVTHCSALPLRPVLPQRCFPYEKQMDGMQAALAGLPAAGVYLLGAALAAGLGGAGFVGAQALAPGARAAGDGCRHRGQNCLALR